MTEWQPIETAPNNIEIWISRDSGETELVLAYDNDFSWQKYNGVNENNIGIFKPTHWHPSTRPAAPVAS